MNTELLVLLISGLFALIYSLYQKRKILILIVAIQVLSILFILFIDPTLGFLMYGLSLLTVLLFAIFGSFKSANKLLFIVFTIPLLLKFILEILSLPYIEFINLSLLITVGIFLYCLLQFKKYRLEVTIMLFLAVKATFSILPVLFN